MGPLSSIFRGDARPLRQKVLRMYVYYCRTYEKAVSGGGESLREKGGHVLRATTSRGAFESGHLTLVSGAGEGEVVSKEVGEEERGAQG